MLLYIEKVLFDGEGTWSEMLLNTELLARQLPNPGRSPEGVALEFASTLNRRLVEVADKLFEHHGNKAWLMLPDGRKLEIKLVQ